MTIDPQKIRRDTLAIRDSLTQAEINDASAAICNTLLSLPEIVDSNTIFAYVSFRSEISTFKLIEALMTAEKTVAVPLTQVK